MYITSNLNPVKKHLITLGHSFMPPEVCLGDYIMESDLWSLCATFYWVFKKRGPYYPKKRTNAEGENFEIMMNKWQCINYDKLTAKECGDLVLREIVNDTLTKKTRGQIRS
jgi:hypothetical protein